MIERSTIPRLMPVLVAVFNQLLAHAPESTPLVLAGASPHAGVLAAGQSPLQAAGADLASCAYLFGPADLNQRRPGVPDREEQLGIDVAARGVITPVRAF